mgnify:CR=1 FL=1
MPTSATCRTRPAPRNAARMRRDGFTLLEMIVVLAILGLATAMVAPITAVIAPMIATHCKAGLCSIVAKRGSMRATR